MKIDTIIDDRQVRDSGGFHDDSATFPPRPNRVLRASTACGCLVLGCAVGYLVRDHWKIQFLPSPAMATEYSPDATVDVSPDLPAESGTHCDEPSVGEPIEPLPANASLVENAPRIDPVAPQDAANTASTTGFAAAPDIYEDLPSPGGGSDSATVSEWGLECVHDEDTNGPGVTADIDSTGFDPEAVEVDLTSNAETSTNGPEEPPSDHVDPIDELEPEVAHQRMQWTAPCGAIGAMFWVLALVSLHIPRMLSVRRVHPTSQPDFETGRSAKSEWRGHRFTDLRNS